MSQLFVFTEFDWLLLVFSVYFLFANGVSLILLAFAVWSMMRRSQQAPLQQALRLPHNEDVPGVSLIAPAFNEEATIIESVNSFVHLQFPRLEIVVVCDGCTDLTLQLLIEHFELIPTVAFVDDSLKCEPIRSIFASRLHENLLVIDKENGGKADALNAGIRVSSHDLICSVDADSMLEVDALLRVVEPFVNNPGRTLASGGAIRVANGSKVRHGAVTEPRAPTELLPLMQVVEYLRAFLLGRAGWNALEATMIISGAFGVFRRDALMAIGGYRKGVKGEDMELVLDLHRAARAVGEGFRIEYVPEPVCWTEVPSDFRSLGRQRRRWQHGLAVALSRNSDMLLNPRFRWLGLFAFPYFFFVELLGPLVELGAYCILGIGWYKDALSPTAVVSLIFASLVLSCTVSLFSVIVEEMTCPRYPRASDMMRLGLAALVEALFLRQLNLIWRLLGLVDWLRGRSQWGKARRSGFSGGRA